MDVTKFKEADEEEEEEGLDLSDIVREAARTAAERVLKKHAESQLARPSRGLPGMPTNQRGLPGMPSSQRSLPGMPSDQRGLPGMPSSQRDAPPAIERGQPRRLRDQPKRYQGQRPYGRPRYLQRRRGFGGRGAAPRRVPQSRPRTVQQRDLQYILRVRQTAKFEADKAKRFDEVTAMLLNHDAKLLKRPQTAFQSFVDEKRKDNPRISISAVNIEWNKLADKEARKEKSWRAYQTFLGELQEHKKKRLEMINELRGILGMPQVLPRERLVRGFDLFWKETEPKVKETNPNLSEYELLQKRKELWGKLTQEKKRLYILQSLLEQEKFLHTRKMAGIENRIQMAKTALNGPGVAA